jgi:hypothetical protein
LLPNKLKQNCGILNGKGVKNPLTDSTGTRHRRSVL